jgi:hypothetical protein
MNTNRVIQELFRLGHFDNPAHKTGVTKDELPSLQLTDAPVRKAIASYQEFMAADFDRLALQEHGRIGIADGDVGPATEKLFEVERCGCPDYEAAVAEETGRGSWPAGCHNEFPGKHAFAVHFDRNGMPTHWRLIFDDAWLLVRQAYADIGIAFFEVDATSKANTVVTWQRSRTWIGLAIVPRSPSCRDRIWAKFDTAYGSSFVRQKAVDQIARLMAHEFCHNMGLSHTRGGIMNPSITSGTFRPNAWRDDPSEPALVRFFGGDPVDLGIGDPKPDPDPEPPPPDPKPPGPNEFWFKGDFTLMQGDKSLGDYILTPKPQV